MAQTCAKSMQYSTTVLWAVLCAHRYRSMSLGTVQKRGGKPGESRAEGSQHGQGPRAHDSEGEAKGAGFV